METFKIVFMGILVIITNVYLFYMISKLPKMIAAALYVIVGAFIIAMIVMIIWYPESLKTIVDYLNIE